MGNTNYVRAFTDQEMSEFANIWKANGQMLKKLQDAVVYKATIDLVESKREKEIVEKVALMQNSLLEGFFDIRSAKTK